VLAPRRPDPASPQDWKTKPSGVKKKSKINGKLHQVGEPHKQSGFDGTEGHPARWSGPGVELLRRCLVLVYQCGLLGIIL
jgi:hypothetical protein